MCSINWDSIARLGGAYADAAKRFFDNSGSQITGGLDSLRSGLRAVFQPQTIEVCVVDATRTGPCVEWMPSLQFCTPPYQCGGGTCSTSGGACRTSGGGCRTSCPRGLCKTTCDPVRTTCDPVVTTCEPIRYCQDCTWTERTCTVWAPVNNCNRVCVANCY